MHGHWREAKHYASVLAVEEQRGRVSVIEVEVRGERDVVLRG